MVFLGHSIRKCLIRSITTVDLRTTAYVRQTLTTVVQMSSRIHCPIQWVVAYLEHSIRKSLTRNITGIDLRTTAYVKPALTTTVQYERFIVSFNGSLYSLSTAYAGV